MTEEDPHTLEEAKTKRSYFKKMPYFDRLVENCVTDTKQSALDSGKWSSSWEEGIRKICRERLGAFLFSEIIRDRHPELYKRAYNETDD